MKNKDNALNDFLTMIYQSWTYAKLTDKEKEKMHDIIVCRSHLRGSWDARYEILNDLYYAFLVGLGYTPLQWRDTENTLQF